MFLQDNREKQKIAGQFLMPLFVIWFLRIGKCKTPAFKRNNAFHLTRLLGVLFPEGHPETETEMANTCQITESRGPHLPASAVSISAVPLSAPPLLQR